MSCQKQMALLISGGINRTLNHPRYLNDLQRWCVALQARGFDCAVCFTDGSGLTVAGARVRPATRSDIDVELAHLAGLAPDDLAVVLVSNHGDATGFCTWGGTDRISPADLSQALGGCAATKILILGQCYSGIFSSMMISNAVVITACGPHEPSWASENPPGPSEYDEFLFQFSEALFGPVTTTTIGNPCASGVVSRQPSNPTTAAPVPASLPAAILPSLRTAYDQAVVRDRRPETPSITDAGGLAHMIVL